MATVKLSQNETIKLINMYREFECLWNYGCEDYRRSDLKCKAWAEIATQFDCSASEIKKKIKYLRTAYTAEKRKVQHSKRSGSSGGVYEPSLFYFNKFTYLDAATLWRQRCTSFEESSSCLDWGEVTFEETTVDDTEGSEPASRSKRKHNETPDYAESIEATECSNSKRKMNEETDSNFITAVDAIVKSVMKNYEPKEGDTFAAFGKSIGMQLKNLPLIRATKIMAQIQNTLTDETISALHEKEDRITTAQDNYNGCDVKIFN